MLKCFKMDAEHRFKGIFSFVWDIAKVIILSLIIIIPVRWFIVQPFFVRGASMEPTYDHGDYLLVDEISYRFEEPQRGDVIVFRFPNDTSQFYIKRIIALPEETIVIREGSVRIINQEHPEGFFLREAYLEESTLSELEITLEDDEYFVLGDNRNASYDSRKWGVLGRKFIVGRAFLRAWPFDRFDLLKTPVY